MAQRAASGKIKRSASVKREFLKQTGYPHGRKAYVVDHIVALECGGADTPANMQWQTISEAKIKDEPSGIVGANNFKNFVIETMRPEPNRMHWKEERLLDMAKLLAARLKAPALHFDERLRSNLPEEHGTYAISLMGAAPGQSFGLAGPKPPQVVLGSGFIKIILWETRTGI